MTNTTTRFEAHRGRMLGLGYRMLGSRADAEDAVQDAWLKWEQSEHTNIQSDEAYLTTIVTRLCLDRIKQERTRRDAYIGPWLPEPITDIDALSACSSSELADDLSYALLVALERLSPLERAAFLLHDVFDTPFSEVASALDRSEAAVRQLAARARKGVRETRPAQQTAPGMHDRLLTAFLTALNEGNPERLKKLFREDAIFVSDGGGRKPSATRPVIGASRIVKLLLGTRRRFSAEFVHTAAAFQSVNGETALLTLWNENVQQMLTIAVDGEHIAAVYTISNPQKLSGLTIPNSSQQQLTH